MSDTTFVDNTTPSVNAAWLNDVNIAVYRAIGTGGVAPTTAAQVLANLGLTTLVTTLTAWLSRQWTDKTSTRAFNTVYQNTNAYPIFLEVNVVNSVGGPFTLKIGGTNPPTNVAITVGTSAAIGITLPIEVPPGNYYEVTNAGSSFAGITSWWELE